MKTQQQLPIRTVVSKLEESIQKLTATISKQQTTIDALQEKVETCELKIDSLEKENVRLKSGNSTIESSENSDVATEATLERELSLILSPKTDNDKKANQQPTTSESETNPTSIFLSLLLNIKDAESKIIEIIKNGWHINLKKWTKCLEILRP